MTRSGRYLAAAVIALVGIASGTCGIYNSDLRRALSNVPAGIIAKIPGGSIEYAVKGAGVPLLSIHGAGGGYDQGLANVADLVGEGFRVVAPSRFGYLRTPIPADASTAAQADAHAALLTELKIPKTVVVGISAGARSAMELAIRHPEKVSALILIVPGTYSPASPVAIEKSRGSQFAFWLVNNGADFAWWAAEKIAPSLLIRFIGTPPGLVAASSPTEQVRVRTMVRNIQPLSLRFAGIQLDSNPEAKPPQFERIAAPTLVVSAQDDLFNTLPAAKYAAGKIAGARLVVYETGGHLLVGRQSEVRKAIRDFLAESTRPGDPA